MVNHSSDDEHDSGSLNEALFGEADVAFNCLGVSEDKKKIIRVSFMEACRLHHKVKSTTKWRMLAASTFVCCRHTLNIKDISREFGLQDRRQFYKGLKLVLIANGSWSSCVDRRHSMKFRKGSLEDDGLADSSKITSSLGTQTQKERCHLAPISQVDEVLSQQQDLCFYS